MARTLYPLSVDLHGKPVLVAGGGPVAARKLAELVRCGADITLVAPKPCVAVERMTTAIQILRRSFKSGDELDRYLVFACTDNAVVNQEIAALCRRGNILCNVADASEAGTFHVPGVLRQGNVTITVSTGGAAPGLTRYLKSHLSKLIGEETAQLATALGRFRMTLRSGPHAAQATSILEGLPYRKLLEDMKSQGLPAVEAFLAEVERSAGIAQGENSQEVAGQARTASVPPQVQPVTLIGAGPGHPGLLTLLGAEALRRAEVIIHDRLIPVATLQLATSDCLLIPAGKRGHFESSRQEEIEAKLVDLALQGKRVVRLKGGDPFVFGRGWEEVLALEANGIPWTVIPGVSSTTAGPTWAGIPLTHRGVARSYAVMSGMAYSQTNTEIPHADTIVLVMGLQKLEEIVPAFLKQGWDAATPVAAIQGATTPDQRICISTLENIHQATVRLGFDSPTLLIIGKVVGLTRGQIPDTGSN